MTLPEFSLKQKQLDLPKPPSLSSFLVLSVTLRSSVLSPLPEGNSSSLPLRNTPCSLLCFSPFSPAYPHPNTTLLSKPLLALFLTGQQARRLQPPAWLPLPLAMSTWLVSYRKGSPTLQKIYNENRKKGSGSSPPGPHHNRGLQIINLMY